MPHQKNSLELNMTTLVEKIKQWGKELGFSAIGISGIDVSASSDRLSTWLDMGFNGGMDYMAKHAGLRASPPLLVDGTRAIITARLSYHHAVTSSQSVLTSPQLGHIARYALGRDYHKTVRNLLQKLATRIESECKAHEKGDHFGYRVFADSAPVFEVELARQGGIGWRGKNTLSLTRQGSYDFLGEIYTTLPLPPDTPIQEHCGSCVRCITSCPTGAITAPYQIDARRCISYLTIEAKGSIPEEFRPLIGNRIYGCDDCQLCCPWNKYAQIGHPDFMPRHQLDMPSLLSLFSWTETEFDRNLAGSPIRRIGFEQWLRNLAVGLGNAPYSPEIIDALNRRKDHPSPMVREHLRWAILQQANKANLQKHP